MMGTQKFKINSVLLSVKTCEKLKCLTLICLHDYTYRLVSADTHKHTHTHLHTLQIHLVNADA